MRRLLLGTLLVTACEAPAPAASRRPPPPDPCAGHPASVVVDGPSRRLHLCDRTGTSSTSFPVSLGRGGSGKTKEGDGKTPLGTYPLGAPRPSYAGYHLFIPVGYPTAEQRKQGYTGGAIGIHGPPEGWPEPAVAVGRAMGDWTLGCIAVARAAEIRSIADWVREEGIDRIHLR